MTGARAGTRERFDKPVIAIGRGAESDLRFDPQDDLDVSTRHAELRSAAGAWTIHDLGSTNGTFVNGQRVVGERRVNAGDTIGFGANGPRMEVVLPGRTTARVAQAVRAETASLRRVFAATVALLVIALAVGVVWWQRQSSARDQTLLAAITHREGAPAATPMAELDVAGIHDRNDAAVALIASDLDGAFMAGTAFGVSPSGLLVTNRHVVRATSGAAARRVRVLYANTRDWLPAHLVRTSDTDDLALIQLDAGGAHPVVAGVSRDGAPARVGARVATIGYPQAVSTPMEGEGLHVTARTSTTTGTVSKRLDDVLQIDTYAGKGSSGSPVFDARGDVVGVVYGGAPESNGRIVYAVPALRLAAFVGREIARVR